MTRKTAPNRLVWGEKQLEAPKDLITFTKADEMRELLSVSLRRAIDLTKEKASAWMTILPLVGHGFTLQKSIATKDLGMVG